MFAFNPFIGVLARSFNLFRKSFLAGLTRQKAAAANMKVIGQNGQSFREAAGKLTG
ncbi:hypothetical protein [Pseudomonas profundi]|uniref:hypothetical protein n=1 Tax=Pseudomonas profundi TaxID=1981513 RepID=UPI001680E5B6|nr:hypothetical protein [Pseudomonas profundi]